MSVFDPLPPYIEIFYLINVENIFGLPTPLLVQRSLWKPPNMGIEASNTSWEALYVPFGLYYEALAYLISSVFLT